MIEATICFPAVHAFGLPALSDRMREIAFCLDVTEAADPSAELAWLLADNPTLTVCRLSP